MKRHPQTDFRQTDLPHMASSLPPLWLFSDERLQNRLLDVVASLPVGSGVVLRHDDLPVGARYRLMRGVMRVARLRQLTVILAGEVALARRWGAHGVHVRHHMARQLKGAGRRGLLLSMPVHNRREAVRARKMGAHIVFISPLYATRSHEGAAHLGDAAWRRLTRDVGGAQVVALGGMSAAAARVLNRKRGKFHKRAAWAGIDALDQACTIKRAKRRGGRKR